MNKRFQVFVSSTYTDLISQREKVIFGLNKIGFIAVGMEQFPSTDESQMEYINKVIDESDYYVVILRGKYGSTASDGVSYTEKEFNYATIKGIPCLAFIFKDFDKLQRCELDDDVSKQKKFIKFKKRLEKDRIVSYWRDDNELLASVKDSVQNIVRTKPGIGYIRGDQALDINIVNERERLLQENALLQYKLNELGKGAINGEIPPGGKRLKDLNSATKFRIKVLQDTGTKQFEETEITVKWHSVLIACAYVMEHTNIESAIVNRLPQILCQIFMHSSDLESYAQFSSAIVTGRRIRAQLEALGYINTASRITEIKNEHRTDIDEFRVDIYTGNKTRKEWVTQWELTPKGKIYVAYHLAEKENLDE